MADPLSVVASVISIADAGIKLASNLYAYSDCAYHAEKQVRDIARETKATSSVLRELGQVLESDARIKLCSPNAFLTAQDALQECTHVFGEIDQALKTHREAGGKPILPTLTRFRKLAWPLKKEKMELLRSNLEKLKSTLILMLQVLSYARVLACEKPDNTQTDQLQQRIAELARAHEESTEKYERLRTELESSVAQRKRYYNGDDQFLPPLKEADDASPRPITMRTVVEPPQYPLAASVVTPGSCLEIDAIIPPPPSEQSESWSLDQVLVWLAQRGFSNDWQETFKTLDLHGSAFLNFACRPNVAFIYDNVILLEVRKQCIQSGTGWNEKREREERDESLRLRKEIRVMLETGVLPGLRSLLRPRESSSTRQSDILSAQDLERCSNLITILLEHVENAQQALRSQITIKGHPRSIIEDVYARVRGDLDKIITREPCNTTSTSNQSIALVSEESEYEFIKKPAPLERQPSSVASNEFLTAKPKPGHAQHQEMSPATPLVMRPFDQAEPLASEAQQTMFTFTRSNGLRCRPKRSSVVPFSPNTRPVEGEPSRVDGQQNQGANGSYWREACDQKISPASGLWQAKASRPQDSEVTSSTEAGVHRSSRSFGLRRDTSPHLLSAPLPTTMRESRRSPHRNLPSPAPLLRPPIPGSRSNSSTRMPKLSLAIPPSPDARLSDGGPSLLELQPLHMPGSRRTRPPLCLARPSGSKRSRVLRAPNSNDDSDDGLFAIPLTKGTAQTPAVERIEPATSAVNRGPVPCSASYAGLVINPIETSIDQPLTCYPARHTGRSNTFTSTLGFDRSGEQTRPSQSDIVSALLSKWTTL